MDASTERFRPASPLLWRARLVALRAQLALIFTLIKDQRARMRATAAVIRRRLDVDRVQLWGPPNAAGAVHLEAESLRARSDQRGPADRMLADVLRTPPPGRPAHYETELVSSGHDVRGVLVVSFAEGAPEEAAGIMDDVGVALAGYLAE